MKKLLLLILFFVQFTSFGNGPNQTNFYCNLLIIEGEKNPCFGTDQSYKINYEIGGCSSCIEWEAYQLDRFGNGTEVNQISLNGSGTLTEAANGIMSNCGLISPIIKQPGEECDSEDFDGVSLSNIGSTRLYVRAAYLGIGGICGTVRQSIDIYPVSFNPLLGAISGPTILDCSAPTNYYDNYTYTVSQNQTVNGNYTWTIPVGWVFIEISGGNSIPMYDKGRTLTTSSRTITISPIKPDAINTITNTLINPSGLGLAGVISVSAPVSCGTASASLPISYVLPKPTSITQTNVGQCGFSFRGVPASTTFLTKLIWDSPAIVNPSNSLIATFSFANALKVATTIKVKAEYACGTSDWTTRVLNPPATANVQTPAITLNANSGCNAVFNLDQSTLRRSNVDYTGIEWLVYKLRPDFSGYESSPTISQFIAVSNVTNNTFVLDWNNIASSPSYRVTARANFSCAVANFVSAYPISTTVQFQRGLSPSAVAAILAPSQTLNCFANGNNTFVSNPLYSAGRDANYNRDFLNYRWELRETGTATLATLARFATNNSTQINNTASNSVAVNYRGQKRFDLCVQSNTRCGLSGWQCRTIQPYQGATDIAIVSQPPFISDQNYIFSVVPNIGQAYSLQITPQEIYPLNGNFHSLFNNGIWLPTATTSTPDQFSVRVGRPVTKGFVITAISPAVGSCPSTTFSKTFPIMSDYDLRVSGVNFEVIGQNYVHKSFIKVPLNTNADLTRLDFEDKPFTFEAWILPNGTQQTVDVLATIFSNYNYDQQTGLKFGISKATNKLAFGSFGVNVVSTNANYNLMDGQCHHVAFSRSGTSLMFYVDGTLTDTFVIPINANFTSPQARGYVLGNETTNATGRFGEQLPASNFNGMIREVKVWNTARTPAQIAEYMFKPVNPTTSELTSYLRLNEGAGDIAFETVTKTDPDPTKNDPKGAINGIIGNIGSIYLSQPATWSKLTCTPSILFRKGLEDIDSAQISEIKVYPNPSSGIISIDLPYSEEKVNAAVSLLDLTGKILYSGNLTELTTEVELANYVPHTSGMYMLQVIVDGKAKIFKLVLEP